jgi:hypothetical protein
MHKHYHYSIITLICATLLACNGMPSFPKSAQDDTNAKTYHSLVGKWKLRTGQVGGQPTDRLDGTVFEFSEDKQLTTNLPTINGGAFKINDNNEIEHSAETSVVYAINTLQDTTLVLTLDFRKNKFQMQFGRE